jgi:hypothetical protein
MKKRTKPRQAASARTVDRIQVRLRRLLLRIERLGSDAMDVSAIAAELTAILRMTERAERR